MDTVISLSKTGDSNVAILVMGQSPSSESYNSLKEGLPFYQGKSDFGNIYPSPRIWCSSPLKIGEKNDTLLSVRAPVGDVNLATEKCCLGRGVAAIRPSKSTNSAFLFFAMLWSKTRLSSQSTGTTFQSINKSTLENFEIPYPSKSEQQKIAAVLWKIQQAIEIEEKLIATTRELKRSAMHQLFTKGLRGQSQKDSEIGLIPQNWDVKQFEKLREFLQYGTSTKCDYKEIGNPVLRIPNIIDGKISDKDLKWCELNKKEVASWILKDGDVIFIRTNGVKERVGTCAVYRGQPEQALFASYLIRARLKTDLLNPDFFQYYISTAMGTSFLGGQASPAADGKFNINTKTIDSVVLPLPELKEQEEIVHILQKIDQRISLHERKKATLQELFQSLLHKLMTGEIRVNDLDIDVSEII